MAANNFDQFILENHIFGFFEKAITLKSGRQSHFYVNWRDATNDAFLLDQLTDYIVSFLQSLSIPFDSLYGVPEGATKTATIASLKLAKSSPNFAKGSHIIPMGRAKPKEHGTPKDKYFIGMPQGKTVILEDTTTTGLSLIKSIDQLLESGVEIVAAISLTDRMEKRDDGFSVKEYIEKQYNNKISYHSMSNALSLIPLAYSEQKPSPEIKEALNKEFNNYGVQTIKWGN